MGKGVDIYIGKTDCPLCPVTAVMAYMASRGPSSRPFFKLANGNPLTSLALLAELGQVFKQFTSQNQILLTTASVLGQPQQQHMLE